MPLNYLKQKTQSLSPDFLLLLLLLFWIPMENTLFGRLYTHVLGLNGYSALASERVVSWFQSALLFTIAVPFLIMLSSAGGHPRRGAISLVRIGLIIWLLGAVISTGVHRENALVVLNCAAGVASATMVFFAIRTVRMDTVRHYELAFRCMAIGSLIPCAIDLYHYQAQWGIPSISSMIATKYDTSYWSLHCTFGNPDNASCAYGLFAMLCMPVAFGRAFGRATRVLACITLVAASLNILLTMSRTGIVFLAIAFVVTALFIRSRMLFVAFGIAGMGLITVGSSPRFSNVLDYFVAAVKYDRQDASAASRIESMHEGWEVFQENPVIGIGPGQSKKVIEEVVPHELVIWQAAENGVCALVGVILVTAACFWALAVFIRAGPKSIASQIKFVFALAPTMYFGRGLVSDAPMNDFFVNTWICFVFAALAIMEVIDAADPNPTVELQGMEVPVARPSGKQQIHYS